MVKVASFPFVAVALVFATAGCFQIEATEPTKSHAPTPSSAAAAGPTTSAPPPAVPTMANVTAALVAGSAPLMVNFTLANDGKGTTQNWTLSYGDANQTNGTKLPANATHTYTSSGNFTVLFTINGGVPATRSNDTASISVKATASGGSTPPPASSAPPVKTTYTAGATLGCVTEIGSSRCGAVVRGTTDTAFGLWIRLEVGHVGMNFTTKGGQQGDSDAWFFDDPAKAPLADDVSNGGKEATGRVPATAKWLLVFSWAAPSTGLTVTFK